MGSHRIRRNDVQVQLLAKDLAKAAHHPVVEDRPLGRQREWPDIRVLGGTGGTDLFDVNVCHPLSQARIRDALENELGMLKAAWTAKVSRYARMMQAGNKHAFVASPVVCITRVAPKTPSRSLFCGNHNFCRGFSSFSEKYFFPAPRGATSDKQCSLPDARTALRHLEMTTIVLCLTLLLFKYRAFHISNL